MMVTREELPDREDQDQDLETVHQEGDVVEVGAGAGTEVIEVGVEIGETDHSLQLEVEEEVLLDHLTDPTETEAETGRLREEDISHSQTMYYHPNNSDQLNCNLLNLKVFVCT